jgi:hypothetical protein
MSEKTTFRFGWYLVNADKLLDFSIMKTPMDQENYLEFRHYTRVVEVLRPFLIDYTALKADAAIVASVCDQIQASLNKTLERGFPDIPETVAIHSEAQRCVSNYLSSASAFRGRAVTRLSLRYGNGAESEKTKFETRVSEIFDRSFGYRLLSILRNHAQHHENPLSLVKTKVDRDDAGVLTSKMGMQLNTAALVSNKALSKRVRAELSSRGDEQIDLEPIIAQNMGEHSEMFAYVLELHGLQLGEMAHYAAAIYRILEPPPGAMPCVFDGPGPGKMMMAGFDEMAVYFRMMDHFERERHGPA